MAQMNFDANNVDPSNSFDPLPAGWYKAAIVESSMEQTKAGTGQYLKLKFQVLDGEFQNRTVFANLTLNHPNATTVEIAQRNLSAICHAIGVMSVSDSQQLHDKPMLIKLTIRTSDQYGDQNDVKEFKALDGAPPASQPAPAAQTAAQPSNGGQAPWERTQ